MPQIWCSGFFIKEIVPDQIGPLGNISGSMEDKQEISQSSMYLNTYTRCLEPRENKFKINISCSICPHTS